MYNCVFESEAEHYQGHNVAVAVDTSKDGDVFGLPYISFTQRGANHGAHGVSKAEREITHHHLDGVDDHRGCLCVDTDVATKESHGFTDPPLEA